VILILHENGIKRNKIYAPDQGEKSQVGLFFGGRWVHFTPARKTFYKAAQQYDLECHSNGKPASFKTFLGIVIARAFSNYCRQRRRYCKRFAQGIDDEASPAFIASPEEIRHFSPRASGGNGYSHSPTEWREMLRNELSSDRLAEVLSRLKPKEIALLALWLQCGRDKEVAAALRISTAAAKQRRERLFRRIKQRLKVK
jgi:DNA-directed RNA polymerase specialized sigma24 family protein